MDSMDELRSPSLPPTSPAVPIIVFPLPSMLPVLQLLETIRCPEKPRAAHWSERQTAPEQQKPLPRWLGEGLGTAGVHLKAEAETRPRWHDRVNGALPAIPCAARFEGHVRCRAARLLRA